MAFTSVANSPARFSAEPIYEDGRWFTVAQIGFDPYGPDGPITYYLFVQFYPSEGSIEYAFGLTWSNNVTRKRGQTYHSSVAGKIIPKDFREDVLQMLEFYTFIMLRTFKIDELFMETYDKDLPEEALVKYERLCEVFSSLGYSASPAQPTVAGKRRLGDAEKPLRVNST